MKSSIVAVIVVIVVVVGGIGFIAVKDPGLLSFHSSSTALPATSPGIRVVATSEINSSMTGGWYEVLNLTVGVSNLSTVDGVLSNLSGSSSSGTPLIPNNATYFNVNYAQAALFVTRNSSSLGFGYAAFNSVNYANLTNQTIFSNITKENISNVQYGEVSGSFYIYGFNKTGDNYSSAIYAIYSNYLIVGFYHGLKNRSMSAFTSMITDEVSILKAYHLSFISAEKLLPNSNITTALGNSYKPDFNMSLYLINPALAFNDLKNTSTFHSDQNSTSSILNLTHNGTGVVGLAMESFSSPGKIFALGYLEAASQSMASQAYANLTTDLSNSLNESGMQIQNQSYNGLKFFEFNISSPNGPNITFSVGFKGDYLVFSVDYGAGSMLSQLKQIMEEESTIL